MLSGFSVETSSLSFFFCFVVASQAWYLGWVCWQPVYGLSSILHHIVFVTLTFCLSLKAQAFLTDVKREVLKTQLQALDYSTKCYDSFTLVPCLYNLL